MIKDMLNASRVEPLVRFRPSQPFLVFRASNVDPTIQHNLRRLAFHLTKESYDSKHEAHSIQAALAFNN
jgi:hypothetical protein